MASFETGKLLDDLHTVIQTTTARVKELQPLGEQLLNTQPGPGRWSIAQVLEHLNSYYRYYLPAMSKALQKARRFPAQQNFRSGWLGNYFTNMMKPGTDGAIANKMQAPKGYRPENAVHAGRVVEEFLAHQDELLRQLDQARSVGIGRVRVPISISPLVRLKLGDTFRFNVAHIQRHLVQVEKTLSQVKREM